MFEPTTVGKLRVNERARIQINGELRSGEVIARQLYGRQVELEFIVDEDGNWCLSRDEDEPCERWTD